MKIYKNLLEAYGDKLLINTLISFAKRRLYNKNFAADAVQDAFSKLLEKPLVEPKQFITEYVLKKRILDACRVYNKYEKEVQKKDVEGGSSFELGEQNEL